MTLPQLGQHLYLVVPDGTHRGNYESYLYEVDDFVLHIDLPVDMNGQKVKDMPKGTNVMVCYRDKSRVPCKFTTFIEGRSNLNQNELLSIKRPTAQSIERIQRRDYARVRVPSIHIDIVTKQNIIQCTMQDISGGGLSAEIHRDQSIELHKEVEIRFKVEVNSRIFVFNMTGRIVRVEKQDDSHNLFGIKFTNATELERQRIIQYVSYLQIERRRREKLITGL